MGSGVTGARDVDLLLDVNIVVDICQPRADAGRALLAIERCRQAGGRIWLYAGAVQSMQYVLADGLARDAERADRPLSRTAALRRSAALLAAFTKDKLWLAALAGEGSVFSALDPEDEQFKRAMVRFGTDRVRLLTRDKSLLNYCQQAISIEDFLARTCAPAALDFIDLAAQQDRLREGIENGIHRVLHHGAYIMGPEVTELEAQLAAYTGSKYCITVANGTDALLIAMMALGIQRDDEIITTPFSFFATVEAIMLLGAKPIFVDIDPRTYNIDPSLIESAITGRTKAIVPVSLYGQCAEFDSINKVAARHGLPVVEDAAQSFGATYRGRQSCALSTVACTSFYPAKPLGAYGDGGACFTDLDQIAESMRTLRDHGQRSRYQHTEIGLNSRLDTIQAAIVLSKLQILPAEIKAREVASVRYARLLKSARVPFEAPFIAPTNTSVYAQYTLRTRERDALVRRFVARAIPVAIHYPTPLHLQPALSHFRWRNGQFPQAESAAAEVFSLPMHPYLDEEMQIRVVQGLVPDGVTRP